MGARVQRGLGAGYTVARHESQESGGAMKAGRQKAWMDLNRWGWQAGRRRLVGAHPTQVRAPSAAPPAPATAAAAGAGSRPRRPSTPAARARLCSVRRRPPRPPRGTAAGRQQGGKGHQQRQLQQRRQASLGDGVREPPHQCVQAHLVRECRTRNHTLNQAYTQSTHAAHLVRVEGDIKGAWLQALGEARGVQQGAALQRGWGWGGAPRGGVWGAGARRAKKHHKQKAPMSRPGATPARAAATNA